MATRKATPKASQTFDPPYKGLLRPLTLAQAKGLFPHRFTMEHIPRWVKAMPRPDSTAWYYAPHFRSDEEWYENTRFPGEMGVALNAGECESFPTWPHGRRLKYAYSSRTLPEPYAESAEKPEQASQSRASTAQQAIERVKEYDDRLNYRAVAPTGDDYNEVLTILGVHE